MIIDDNTINKKHNPILAILAKSSLIASFAFLIGGWIIWGYLKELELHHLFTEILTQPTVFLMVIIYLTVFSYVIATFLILCVFAYLQFKELDISWKIFIIFLLIAGFCISYFCFKQAGVALYIVFVYILLWLIVMRKEVFSTKSAEVQKVEIKMLFVLMLLSLLITLFIYMQAPGFVKSSFRYLAFIEDSKQASWYALDKDFLKKFDFLYVSQVHDSLQSEIQSESLISHLKKTFTETNESNNNSSGSEDNNSSSSDGNNSRYKIQPNALFGFFLWSLGNVKVFCPPTFDDSGPDLGSKIKSECITIDKQFIQLLPSSM